MPISTTLITRKMIPAKRKRITWFDFSLMDGYCDPIGMVSHKI